MVGGGWGCSNKDVVTILGERGEGKLGVIAP